MLWALFERRTFAVPNIVGFHYSRALCGGLHVMGPGESYGRRPGRGRASHCWYHASQPSTSIGQRTPGARARRPSVVTRVQP